ncbi:MAG: TetR family transcriptional regulator [Spirochaetota bacterium]
MKRTKEEAEETKERIVKAAVRVFAEQGFSGAKLSDIASEAGVTRGAIYWHFKNKEALIEELLQRIDSYHVHLVESSRTDDGSLQDRLRRVMRRLIRRQVEDQEWRMMQEIVVRDFLNRRGNVTWMETNSQGDVAAERFFDEIIARGEILGFSDGMTALVAASCFVSGWIIQSIDLEGRLTDGQIEELVEFVVRGFFGTIGGEEEKR